MQSRPTSAYANWSQWMKSWPTVKIKLESVWTLFKTNHRASRKSYQVIICPNAHAKLTQIKSMSSWGSVRTLLKIIHLASSKSYLVIIFPNSYSKLTKSLIMSSSESIRTLLKITHLASRKSYLVIICPNSYSKLTKSEIRSCWSRFKHCSKSLIWLPGSHIWSLFVPMHMQNRNRSSWSQFEHCS